MADIHQTLNLGDNTSPLPLPRVTIQFCTQCKWMLRAAYFAQELLSTFSTALGEVALQPSTGGVFVVEILYYHVPIRSESGSGSSDGAPALALQRRVLWDRKTDGGFPETKELKRRVRDAIQPGRDLGHVDRDHRAAGSGSETTAAAAAAAGTTTSTTVADRPPTTIALTSGEAGEARGKGETAKCEDCV